MHRTTLVFFLAIVLPACSRPGQPRSGEADPFGTPAADAGGTPVDDAGVVPADDAASAGNGGVAVPTAGWRPAFGTSGASLNAVWGLDANTVFIVGDAGTILERQGGAWIDVASGTNANLTSVWGLPSGEVFAAGQGGVVLARGANGLDEVAAVDPDPVRGTGDVPGSAPFDCDVLAVAPYDQWLRNGVEVDMSDDDVLAVRQHDADMVVVPVSAVLPVGELHVFDDEVLDATPSDDTVSFRSFEERCPIWRCCGNGNLDAAWRVIRPTARQAQSRNTQARGGAGKKAAAADRWVGHQRHYGRNGRLAGTPEVSSG